jgi:hypothetical protein
MTDKPDTAVPHHSDNRPREILLYAVLPTGLFLLYLLGMAILPRPGEEAYRWIHGESPHGIIENATALFFFLGAGWFMAAFSASCGNATPGFLRVGYFILALSALFVALEEINYGQFFLNFETPDVIGALSTKDEFNLHNLYGNKPARRLNLIATIGFPMLFIVLPLLANLRYRLPAWFHNLAGLFLPGRCLMLFAILAQLATWLDDIFGWFNVANAWTRATEFKELYWGMGIFFWARILCRRRQGMAEIGQKKP